MQTLVKRILCFLLLVVIMPCFGITTAESKPSVTVPSKQEKQEKQEPEATPVYIKHVMIVAIDDLEKKFFDTVIMPRMVGVSKAGISSNVLDQVTQAEYKAQDIALLSNLPDFYRQQQRKSVLVNGRGLDQGLKYGFHTVLNPNKADLDNPKKIMQLAINHFQQNQPYLTYLTFGSSGQHASEQKEYFRQVDEALGLLLGMLHEQGLYNQTLLIITGRRSPATTARLTQLDAKVPLLFPLCIKGPNLLAGIKIPNVRLTDIPATVLYLTDGKEQEEQGKILWNIMSSSNNYVIEDFLRHRIKDLSSERDGLVNQELLWEKEKLSIQQQRAQLAEERRGITNELASRNQLIKQLELKMAVYKGIGLAGLSILLLGYLVQYYLLRKRFLLF